MEVRILKGAVLALATLAITANADVNRRVESKLQGFALCATIYAQLKDAIAKNNTEKLDQLRAANDVCREAVRATDDLLAQSGTEFYPFGLGMFIGSDINYPHVKGRTSVGGRLAAGATGMIRINFEPGKGLDGVSFLQPEFAPLAVFAINGQNSTNAPRIIEPLVGVIVYLGTSNQARSYDSFNGLYVGAGLETPNFFQSEQRNTSTVSATPLYNPAKGTTAIVFAKSYNGGLGASGAHIQVMSVNNVTQDGHGAKLTDIYNVASEQTKDLYVETAEPAINFVSNTTVEIYNATIGKAVNAIRSLF